MKKFVSFLLTAIMLFSVITASFTVNGAVTGVDPFKSPAITSIVVSGFAKSTATYYKISDDTTVTLADLAYEGNIPIYTQGATCVNDDYYISATFESSLKYNFGYILKYDTSAKKWYVSEQLPISHANDLSYNADTNEIIVCNNRPDTNVVTFINADTLNPNSVRQVSLKDEDENAIQIFAIDYDAVKNRYFACGSGTNTFDYVLDENFQVKETIPRADLNADDTNPPYYIKQGICVTPDYVIRAYAGDPIGTYTNRLVVTDWEGNLIQEANDADKNVCEIQDIFFNSDGYMYIVHHHTSAGSFVSLAKMTAYTVQYQPNGGEGTMANSLHYYGTSSKISKNTFTKEGYVFAGWKVSRKSDGKHLYTNNETENKWYLPASVPSGYKESIYKDNVSISALAHDLFDEVYLEAQWGLRGDADRDEKVNIRDVTTIQLACVKSISLYTDESLCADADADGVISIKDATRIQMYLARLIDEL